MPVTSFTAAEPAPESTPPTTPMNMLPIPALDGGRVFLLLVTSLIETVTGKKQDPKYEAYVHGAGMVLLLGLMAVIMFNDILKIFR